MTRHPRIPKIIWSYWHDHDTMPDVVKKCIESWKTQCPDWDIRVLADKDTPHYKHSGDFIQRHADFLRLDLLNKHGGVWMDASIYLNQPLDDWLFDVPDVDFIGYEIGKNERTSKYIENWFLAAPKGSPFIRDWNDEFMKYNEYDTIDDYLKEEFEGIDYSVITSPHYHLPYVACQKCLQRGGPYKLRLVEATEDAYKYMIENDGFDKLCSGKYKTSTRLVKLPNGQRQRINNTCKL